MSENMSTLLRDALLNNSFDYSSMHDTLKNTWHNSFSYLYEKQKAFIEYKELFYYSNDDVSRNSKLIGHLYVDKWNRASFDIGTDLINVCNREEYRRSRFYQKEFSSIDLITNQSIFLKVPVIMIDNHVIWDYKIKINKETTTIILPFKRSFVIKNERNFENNWDIIYVDHCIQVFVVDNIYYERLNLNKNNINYNRENMSISIPKEYLSDYPKNKDGTMFCSIHIPNLNGNAYELGTSLIDFFDEGEYYTAYLTKSISDIIFKTGISFYIDMIFFNHLHRHIYYNGSTSISDGTEPTVTVIEKENGISYSMPIPIENIILFKKSINDDEYRVLKNTDNVKMSYPNIYFIKDKDQQFKDEYKLFYFFYPNDDLKYKYVFDFYKSFLLNHFKLGIEEVIDKIYRNTMEYSGYNDEQIIEFRQVFFWVLRYQYYHYKYGEMDFLQRYKLLDEEKDDTPWEYKDTTLRNWIMVDPNTLRNYVLDQNKLGDSYHLFTNTIDMPSRLRKNASLEMKEECINFNEDRYVFAMANEQESGKLLNCRVFVDGIMVADLIQERKLFMEYLYIPAEMVTDDSYIEIEIFPSYRFTKEVTFSSLDDVKEITIIEPTENIFPTAADLYYSEKKGSEETRYTNNFFDITSMYKNCEFPVTTMDKTKPVMFTRLNKFKIKPSKNSIEVLNKPINICISKIPSGLTVLMDEAGFPYLEFIENNFNFSIDYIRIYLNGRLLPRIKYAFFSSLPNPKLQILEYCDIGDILYLDITPYRYTEVFYKEKISEDELIIDLKGYINKPFDIRYFDVYMNGRKLSLNNVMSLDPWSFTLVNLKSYHNLTIYERDRDYEFFGLDYNKSIYYFSLEDLMKKNFLSIDDKKELIKTIIDNSKDDRLNIYPNTDEEVPQDYTDLRNYIIMYMFYEDELIPKRYVNPDELQFNKSVMHSDFQLVDDVYHTTTHDGRNEQEKKRREKYVDALCLSPDIVVRIEDDSEIEDRDMNAFSVGHMNTLDENILKEEICISNAYPIENEGGE